MTDQEKLDAVNVQLAEATEGDVVTRLRARRAALEERLGYSFDGAPNRQTGVKKLFDEVKHPRLKGKFMAKFAQRKAGHGPTDPQALEHHTRVKGHVQALWQMEGKSNALARQSMYLSTLPKAERLATIDVVRKLEAEARRA